MLDNWFFVFTDLPRRFLYPSSNRLLYELACFPREIEAPVRTHTSSYLMDQLQYVFYVTDGYDPICYFSSASVFPLLCVITRFLQLLYYNKLITIIQTLEIIYRCIEAHKIHLFNFLKLISLWLLFDCAFINFLFVCTITSIVLFRKLLKLRCYSDVQV